MNMTVSEKTTKPILRELYFPCVAVILVIEPGTIPVKHLNELTETITTDLLEKYNKSRVMPVIEKLQDAFSQVNFTGTKKSVAIFVSPSNQTVIHLDVHFDETVILDGSFEIRDLVHSLQSTDKYLMLVQSAETFRIFLGDNYNLVRLKATIPDNIAAYDNDIPEKIEYFSDTTDRKEVLMDKFIHHIDKELEAILHQHKLPVFVLGTERMNGHFKKYTHNEKAILAYIHGNYDEAEPHQLIGIVSPYLEEIKKIDQQDLADKIEKASNADRISIGIHDVWKNAWDKKGRLLIVEKNFRYPQIADKTGNMNPDITNEPPALVKDAVDIVIEKVLESGGAVKFADAADMSNLQHIALLHYY